MAKLFANQRVNLNAKGQVCTDADPTSASLFATPGQAFDEAQLARFEQSNRDEYFDDGTPEAVANRGKRTSKRVVEGSSTRVVEEAEPVKKKAPKH